MITEETVSKYIKEHEKCSFNCSEYDVNKITAIINKMAEDGVFYSEVDKQQIRQSLVFSHPVPIELCTSQLNDINKLVDFVVSGKV